MISELVDEAFEDGVLAGEIHGSGKGVMPASSSQEVGSRGPCTLVLIEEDDRRV